MPDEIIETTPEITEETSKRYQCRHIFIDGHRCGSPSLRREHFCYYHHPARGFADEKRHRRSWTEFELPPLEDRSSVLAAITEVLQRIACGGLNSKQAGLLLYGLQIASSNLPKTSEAKPDDQDGQSVEEVITDPHFGDLAPIAEIIQEAEAIQPQKPAPNPSAPSPALSSPKGSDSGTLISPPQPPTQPGQPQPITLFNLHASTSANGTTYPSPGRSPRGRSRLNPRAESPIYIPTPSQRKFTPDSPLIEHQSCYPNNCHANEKRTSQPPHSAPRYQAAQRRSPGRCHAPDGLLRA